MAVVTHRLKTHPAAFYAVRDGLKPFEVRKNDRLFQTGDLVELSYWDPNAEEGHKNVNPRISSPDKITKRIGWILGGGQYGVEPGHVVFALEPVDEIKVQAEPIKKPKKGLERPEFEELEKVKKALIGTRIIMRLPTSQVLARIKEICEDYNVTPAIIAGSSRQVSHVRPRHKIMFELAVNHGWSSTEIGELLGGRDHTTALHGIKRHREIMEEEDEAQRQLINSTENKKD